MWVVFDVGLVLPRVGLPARAHPEERTPETVALGDEPALERPLGPPVAPISAMPLGRGAYASSPSRRPRPSASWACPSQNRRRSSSFCTLPVPVRGRVWAKVTPLGALKRASRPLT